jgi:hypothetical protein
MCNHLLPSFRDANNGAEFAMRYKEYLMDALARKADARDLVMCSKVLRVHVNHDHDHVHVIRINSVCFGSLRLQRILSLYHAFQRVVQTVCYVHISYNVSQFPTPQGEEIKQAINQSICTYM